MMLVYGALVLTVVLGLLGILSRIPSVTTWQAMLAVPAVLGVVFLSLRSKAGPILFNLLYRSFIVSVWITGFMVPLMLLLPLT